MQPKMRVVTVSLLGSLLATSAAFAQQAPMENGSQGGSRETTASAPVCPPGCVAARQEDPAAVAARRARRARARARMRQQQAQQQAMAQPQQEQQEVGPREDDERLAREHADAVMQQQMMEERERQARLAAEADRDRLTAELAMMNRPQTVARGGGPGVERRPRINVGIEGGVGTFVDHSPWSFDRGLGSGLHVGPVWGARVGYDVTRWLGVEARYMGMHNDGRDERVGEDVGVHTTMGAATVRLTLPVRYVQPYVFGGVGVYHTALTGSDSARQATHLRRETSAGIPVGLGVNVPLTRRFSVGVESTYHHVFEDDYSTRAEYSEGSPVTTTGLFRLHL